MSGNDHELRISEEDARFVRKLEALYRAPEPTAAARARFASRLEERIARRRARRAWLLGAAVAAAAGALTLAILEIRGPGERAANDTDFISAAEPRSPDETLLLLTNGPLDDADEALPEDYRTLASLLE